VNFTNTVLIMTSNVGSQYITAEEDEARMRERVMDALRDRFRPEFLNRVDEVVIFHRLEPEDLRAIVDVQLRRLERVLAGRGYRSSSPSPPRSTSPSTATTGSTERARSSA
jgi:ATP-dependent Clp protease ATP-binding subunit ClpB